MTLATTASRQNYPGAGSTGPFAYPFRIFAATDLLVVKRSSLGVETTLVYGVGYTVTGVGDASGNVNLTTALAAGETLAIRRKPPVTQPTSIRNQGPYFPATHEDAFDRLTMIDQAQQDAIDRCMKLAETLDPAAYNMTLPNPEAGKVMTGTGAGFTMSTLDSSAVALPGQSRTVLTLSAFLANNAHFNVLDYAPIGTPINTGINESQVTCNTAIAQAAAAGGGIVDTPPGTYLVDGDYNSGKSIRLLSKVTLMLHAGATIQAKTNALASTAVVLANAVTDAAVMGPGIIVGDRATHGGTPATDTGMGILLYNSSRVRIDGPYIKDCQGDGIYVGSTSNLTGNESTDVTITGVTCDNNRRQGISVVAAKRVHIAASSFINTNGNAPSAGIDFEPNAGTAVVQDCTVVGCNFENNVIGVQFGFTCQQITVTGCTFRNHSQQAIIFSQQAVDCTVSQNTIVQNSATAYGIYFAFGQGCQAVGNTIRGTFLYGIWSRGGGSYATNGRNLIKGNRIFGDGVTANSYGIHVSNNSGRNRIEGNYIENMAGHGINADTSDWQTIVSNHISACLQNGINITVSKKCSIIGNISEKNTLRGIFLTSGAQWNTVSGNTVEGNGTDGIATSGATSSDNTITGNTVVGNSQTTTNTSDNIVIVSDRNLVANNVVRVGAGPNVPKYGIEVAGNDNQILWNDAIGGGNTADLRDVGTRTTFTNKPGVATVVYSAAMTPDAQQGQTQTIAVTDGNPMTINAPVLALKGFVLEFEITNSSGGAMGAITWNAAFKLAGAFTNPANTKVRTITFRYNGTNWMERSRAAADI